MEQVHRERCAVDPMYRILFSPESTVTDTDTGNQVVFLDHLVALFIEYVKARYGAPLLDSRGAARVYAMWSAGAEVSAESKIFALAFILRWEPAMYEAMLSMYDDESPYAMNGGSAQLVRVIARIEDFINATLSFPYHKGNIVTTVDAFVTALRKEYIMGPFYDQTPATQSKGIENNLR